MPRPTGFDPLEPPGGPAPRVRRAARRAARGRRRVGAAGRARAREREPARGRRPTLAAAAERAYAVLGARGRPPGDPRGGRRTRSSSTEAWTRAGRRPGRGARDRPRPAARCPLPRRASRARRSSAASIDGRNIWRGDLARRVGDARRARARSAPARSRPARRPRCSTCRTTSPTSPSSTRACASWLAFADQKVGAGRRRSPAASADGRAAIEDELAAASAALADRPRAPGVRDGAVRARAAALTSGDCDRGDYEDARRGAGGGARPAVAADDDDRLVPADRRDPPHARPARSRRALDRRSTRSSSASRSPRSIGLQEELGLDVLVHGEPERNDMVQYFAENLDGLRGDAQRLGAVVRLARDAAVDPVGRRVAPGADHRRVVAVRAVADREAGEGHADGPGDDPRVVVRARRPAARRAPPTRSRSRCATRSPTSRRPASASSRSTSPRCASCCRSRRRTSPRTWTGRSARSASRRPGAATATQVHTHLCYSEFGVVIDAIAALDADVTSIEAARSRMRGRRRHRGVRLRLTASGPASTTSTRRACRRSPRSPISHRAAPSPSSRCARCGSTPTAV